MADTHMSGLDESSQQYAAKVYLTKYGNFSQEIYSRISEKIEGLRHILPSELRPNPFCLQLSPKESTSISRLLKICPNVILAKIIESLAQVCVEVTLLKAEAEKKFYPPLLLYGENLANDSDGAVQVSMGRMLPCLQELSAFIERCYAVVRNIVHQLAGLYNNSPQKIVSTDNLHMTYIFEHLGELLSVLIKLEEIIQRHPVLVAHWKIYVQTVKLVHHNPEKFGADPNLLKPLEMVVTKLNGQLFGGFIFLNCVEQPFDSGDLAVCRNQTLLDEFSHSIRTIFARVEKLLGDPGETTERTELIGVTGLTVLKAYVFRTIDKKLLRMLFDSHKKMPVLYLIGDQMWSPTEFLTAKLKQLDKQVEKRMTTSQAQLRSNYLQLKSQSLVKDTQACLMQIADWLVQVQNIPDWSKNVNRDLELRYNLFTLGVKYAYVIGHLVKSVVCLHGSEKRPMTKSAVSTIFRLVEIIKAIDAQYQSGWMLLAESVNHILSYLQAKLLRIVRLLKDRFKNERKFSDKKLDSLSGLILMEDCAEGPATSQRLLISQLALQFVKQSKVAKDEEVQIMTLILNNLDLVANLQRRMKGATDCSFLYWHRSLLAAYFDEILQNPMESARVEFVFCALNDCLPQLTAVRHLEIAEKATEDFVGDTTQLIEKHLLEELCSLIENDLRLSIHSHLALDDRNPFRNGFAKLKCRQLIELPPLQLHSQFIDIKRYVENYLEKIFYNLTAIALHDWKTYAEMRQLAHQKYKLQLIEPHLPSQTLEQGLDVLEIMRNINVFVTKFNYNLNNQFFVEQTSPNKHLNTINIRHVANSIRTHGSGVMSTTVNSTYQFLRRKFQIFSQFLYDEQIRSRLQRDIRFYREQKESLDQLYPYEKAEKFNRGIRKLGLTEDNLSFLDEFRLLITQVGNALGYVRMIRAGGLQCCAQGCQFVPNLADIPKFAQLSAEATGLNQETLRAAEILDEIVDNLVQNFAEGTEYFRLLVNVFTGEFRSAKNAHLKNFYIIVPPMTVNYVEHIITAKEKLWKKNQIGSFTDDGFAMGVAYILQLIDQYAEFDSLHWFTSVDQRYQKRKDELIAQQTRAKSSQDEKLLQTIQLSLKRCDQYRKEFQLLNFSLTSARIFFRSQRQLIQTEVEIGVGAGGSDAASETSSDNGRKSQQEK